MNYIRGIRDVTARERAKDIQDTLPGMENL
jgi:hypothetical protein